MAPQGHEAAWNGQGPEALLLHVMLEVAEALDGDVDAMLDKVGPCLLASWLAGLLSCWLSTPPPLGNDCMRPGALPCAHAPGCAAWRPCLLWWRARGAGAR